MRQDRSQQAQPSATPPEERRRPPLPRDLLGYARQMRADCTDPELLLWHVLRERRFEGFKFRRQHPIGRCIVDFYCHQAKLAIELDGGDHDLDQQAAYDTQRDAALQTTGIRVLRFWNTDVFQNPKGVLAEIYEQLVSRCPSPRPSPTGRGSG